MTSQLDAFISSFLALDEPAQMEWGRRFREATGGTLSPYANPLAVAVALVPVALPSGVGVLGVRRNIAPHIGGLALPGGYVELGETIAQAAAREVFEETGLSLDATCFKAFGQPALAGPSQLLFQRYDAIVPWSVYSAAAQSLDPEGESQELVILNQASDLCFPLHAQALSELIADESCYASGHGLSSRQTSSPQGPSRPR